MTTIDFIEDIKFDNKNKAISVYEFIEILDSNGLLPKLYELDENEITPEIRRKAQDCKNAPRYTFINI